METWLIFFHKMLRILFLAVLFVVFSTSNANSRNKYPAIDALIQGLKKEVWDNEETPCIEKTLELLENVKNFTLWATWVWDANKLPSGSLYGSWIQIGNFDQCMNPPWLDTHPQFKTQYCLAQVKMAEKKLKRGTFDPHGSTEVFLQTKTRSGLFVNLLTWGVCVPTPCQPRSVAKIVKQLYLGTHFRAISHPNITVEGCQMAGTEQTYAVGFYVFIGLIASLLVMAIGSTYYCMHTTSYDQPVYSNVSAVLKSFCMLRNSVELTRENKDEIKVLNGIRFMTAAGIVLLHVVFFTILFGCVNTRDFDNNMDFFSKLFNLTVLVDTFFALSGLLHIRGLLVKMQQNLFLILWKRYVRLFGLFALAVFYLASVASYTGSGPMWHKIYDPECASCQENWLLSLLMINSSSRTICHAVTWYIACDYQFTVFGIALFYIYRKSRRLGTAAFGVAAVLSVVIPGVLTYWHRLPPILFSDLEHAVDMRGNDWVYYTTYIKSYSRATPYLAGLAMGYFMHVFKPADYRKRISTLWSITGTIFSLLVMMFMLSLGHWFLDRDYGPIEAGIAAALQRATWGAAICCIIGFCEYGTVPLVTGLLSQSYFTPLSRLSYGVFMVHLFIIFRSSRVVAMRSPPVYDFFTLLIDTIGVCTASVGISYVLWLLVEAPLINLSNHFIANRFKSIDRNNVTNGTRIYQQKDKSG